MNITFSKKNIIPIVLIPITLVLSYIHFYGIQTNFQSIQSFDDCIRAGYKTIPTYPERCILPGKVFVNPLQKETVTTSTSTENTKSKVADFKNLSYIIDGKEVKLRGGIGEFTPNSLRMSATTTIKVIGNEYTVDMNNDKILDTVFLLTSDKTSTYTGSYYLGVAVSLNEIYSGMNAIYLGTMLYAVSYTFKNNELEVVFTETASSTPKTKYFIIDNNLFKEQVRK